MFRVLLPHGFLSIKLQAATSNGVQLGTPGYEVDLVYLACLVTLILGGAGPLSLRLFLCKLKRRCETSDTEQSVNGEPRVAG